jgi:hypothetical protein
MRLAQIREVVERQPAIAHAVRRLSLRDQLELTLELLSEPSPFSNDGAKTLPPNVIPFRPRQPR